MAGIFETSSTQAIRDRLRQAQSKRRSEALRAGQGGSDTDKFASGLGVALDMVFNKDITSPELEAAERKDKLQQSIVSGMKEQGLEVGSAGAAKFAAQVAMDAGDFAMAEDAMGKFRQRSEQDQKSTRRGQQIESADRELAADIDPDARFQSAGAGRPKAQQNMLQRMELDAQDGKPWSNERKRVELDKAFAADTKAAGADKVKRLTVQRATTSEKADHKAIAKGVYDGIGKADLAKLTLEAKRHEAEAAQRGETFDTEAYIEQRAEVLKQAQSDEPTPTAGDTFKAIKDGGIDAWEATKAWFNLTPTSEQPKVIKLD